MRRNRRRARNKHLDIDVGMNDDVVIHASAETVAELQELLDTGISYAKAIIAYRRAVDE